MWAYLTVESDGLEYEVGANGLLGGSLLVDLLAFMFCAMHRWVMGESGSWELDLPKRDSKFLCAALIDRGVEQRLYRSSTDVGVMSCAIDNQIADIDCSELEAIFSLVGWGSAGSVSGQSFTNEPEICG